MKMFNVQINLWAKFGPLQVEVMQLGNFDTSLGNGRRKLTTGAEAKRYFGHLADLFGLGNQDNVNFGLDFSLQTESKLFDDVNLEIQL